MNKLAQLVASVLLAGCAAHATVSSGPPAGPPPPPPPGPVVTAPPPAPPPPTDTGQHPAYARALSDLRLARAFLERPAGVMVKWDEKKAVAEIDGAIQNIKIAAMDDGKSLDDHPPVDRPTWGGRLQRAAELVNSAYGDVREFEENKAPGPQKARREALLHIQAASKFIREGEEDAKTLKEPPPGPPPGPPPPGGAVPGAHPAYLHALVDLRHARALLEKPQKPDVKWDENIAIREIDAAIKEIRDAAIDDGKQMSDHPTIDTKLAHRDRLRQAMQLLNKSAHDIEMKEDNAWANGLRNRANMHINAAEAKVREAIGEKEEAKAEKKEEKREEKMEKKEEKKDEKAAKQEQKMEKKDEKNAEKADKKADKKDDKTKAK